MGRPSRRGDAINDGSGRLAAEPRYLRNRERKERSYKMAENKRLAALINESDSASFEENRLRFHIDLHRHCKYVSFGFTLYISIYQLAKRRDQFAL